MKTILEVPIDAVSVGDRFYKIGGGEIVWIVQRVFIAQADGIPHVALVRESDAQDRIVISLAALLEEIIFKPDRRDPKAEVDATPRRRKTDWYPRNLWKKITG